MTVMAAHRCLLVMQLLLCLCSSLWLSQRVLLRSQSASSSSSHRRFAIGPEEGEGSKLEDIMKFGNEMKIQLKLPTVSNSPSPLLSSSTYSRMHHCRTNCRILSVEGCESGDFIHKRRGCTDGGAVA
jgi:hypothetical protein